MPSRTPDLRDERDDAIGDVGQLDTLRGLDRERVATHDEAPASGGGRRSRDFPGVHSGTLAHQVVLGNLEKADHLILAATRASDNHSAVRGSRFGAVRRCRRQPLAAASRQPPAAKYRAILAGQLTSSR